MVSADDWHVPVVSMSVVTLTSWFLTQMLPVTYPPGALWHIGPPQNISIYLCWLLPLSPLPMCCDLEPFFQSLLFFAKLLLVVHVSLWRPAKYPNGMKYSFTKASEWWWGSSKYIHVSVLDYKKLPSISWIWTWQHLSWLTDWLTHSLAYHDIKSYIVNYIKTYYCMSSAFRWWALQTTPCIYSWL